MMSPTTPGPQSLSAVALVCTLKSGCAASSSQLIAEQLCKSLEQLAVGTTTVRCADFAIHPGVEADMGSGDEWPDIRQQVLAADILALSTPVWLGHPSSIAQRVLERLNADLSSTDEGGRPVMLGKVAIVSVVGNEDGAHKTVADLFQGLNDIGFSVPAQGCTYWNGEAMHKKDFKDLEEIPEATAHATAAAARNAAHLASLLKGGQYPRYH